MKILIVNDDGINALGLKILAEELTSLGEVYIFVPLAQQSGMSQALSIHKKIKVKDYGMLYGAKKAIAAKGTPADCVRLGLFMYKDINFDLVISGINQGPNIGSDVLRSGTVGAATEANSLGVPAIAVSSPYSDFSMAKAYTGKLIKYLYANNLVSSNYVLNINFPQETFKKPQGLMFTIQGFNKYEPIFKKLSFNRYKSVSQKTAIEEPKNSDVYCYNNGIISITPLFEDRSNTTFSEEIDKQASQQLNEFINCDKIDIGDK